MDRIIVIIRLKARYLLPIFCYLELPRSLPIAETTKAMLPALMDVVTNALMSLIPDTKAKAIAVPMTDANQVFKSVLLSAIATCE